MWIIRVIIFMRSLWSVLSRLLKKWEENMIDWSRKREVRVFRIFWNFYWKIMKIKVSIFHLVAIISICWRRLMLDCRVRDIKSSFCWKILGVIWLWEKILTLNMMKKMRFWRKYSKSISLKKKESKEWFKTWMPKN